MNARPTSTSWSDATSIADLGWMTIAWLLGDVGAIPINLGPPADETQELVPVLELMNGLGLVSTSSQPGRDDGVGQQRAWVEAFGEPAIVDHVAMSCERAGLYVKVMPMRKAAAPQHIPISANFNGVPHTWAGEPSSTSELIPHFDCRADLRAELLSALTICVIDLEWGRRDLLWNCVLDGLRTWTQLETSVLPTTISTRGVVRHVARALLESA